MSHKPVLLKEVIKYLAPQPDGWYLDATVGYGGHAEAICEKLTAGGGLVGLDRDEEALTATQKRLVRFSGKVFLVKGNFGSVTEDLEKAGLRNKFHGILLDLGVSSPHLDCPERGFSYRAEGTLDMRMDVGEEIFTAKEVVNNYSRDELAAIFWKYGEEKWASRIAMLIVERRRKKAIITTTQLAEIIREAIPAADRRTKGHPARRCFQALRIYVNREIEHLRDVLPQCLALLKDEGRLCVISYHSLEDRMVKKIMAEKKKKCICPPDFPVCSCLSRLEEDFFKPINRKPIYPQPDEIAENPRARSARMRVAEKQQGIKKEEI